MKVLIFPDFVDNFSPYPYHNLPILCNLDILALRKITNFTLDTIFHFCISKPFFLNLFSVFSPVLAIIIKSEVAF